MQLKHKHLAFALAACFTPWNIQARADVISASDAALRSSGTVAAPAVTFTQNGYLGTFITVTTAGTITIAATANGAAAPNGINARLTLSVADSSQSWSVGSTANTYTLSTLLPTGTYFVRAQMDNAVAAPGAQLTISSLDVQGATISNSADPKAINASTLSASDSYIQNFRRGSTTLNLAGIAPRGSSVQIKLVRHAFRFGEEVPGLADSDVSTYLAPNPAPGTTAATFQSHFLPLFNGLTPGNAGKWAYNEATRGAVIMQGVDDILNFSKANHLKVRMHNLIWGSQQPNFTTTLAAACETPTVAGFNSPQADLNSAIQFRVGYYVQNRAASYDELDVYNEPAHTGLWQPGDVQGASESPQPNYWNALGVKGVASIFNDTANAAKQAGNPNLKLFINEYNVLNNSSTPPVTGPSTTQATYINDPYANWYRQVVENIQTAGGAISGVGTEYYATEAIGTADNASHNIGRMHSVFSNLAVLGLPIELTEFGIQAPTTGSQNLAVDAQILTESMRLTFGTPAATGFSMFGFWAGDMWSQAPDADLYDINWNITPIGQAYVDLMKQWSTDVTTSVSKSSTAHFTGFFGDYSLTTAAGKTYTFTLAKGSTVAPVLTLQQ